jgi:hypothetical protein
MTRPTFDFTINFGHLLSVAAMVLTMIVGWVNFDNRLQQVEAALAQATTTFISQVRLEAKVEAQDERVTRLERVLEARE